MTKPRLAHVVLGGCEGCYVSLLDAGPRLLDLLGLVDLVASPLLIGHDVPECDVCIVEGAVTTDRDIEVLKDARAKAKTLVAVGSCAALGGIGGLRNLYCADDVLDSVYGEDGAPTEGTPKLTDRVRPLSDIVDVDVAIPGCAPETNVLMDALEALARGEAWEMPRRNLCEECHRVKEKLLHPSQEFVSEAVYGVMELDAIDPDRCFVEQGVICMGPATREGCGAPCTAANYPCRGCNGPARREFEQGAKLVDALAAVLPAGAIMYLDDLVGTAYRFSLPISVFPAVRCKEGGSDA